MSYKGILFQEDNCSNNTETRKKLLKEKEILLRNPIANSFKIDAINKLLASIEEDEDYEDDRGCATYLFK